MRPAGDKGFARQGRVTACAAPSVPSCCYHPPCSLPVWQALPCTASPRVAAYPALRWLRSRHALPGPRVRLARPISSGLVRARRQVGRRRTGQ